MHGKQFWWLAVFEQFEVVEVTQEEAVVTKQAVPAKHTRSGTIQVSPGQRTADLVRAIEKGVKEADEALQNAVMIDVTLIPNQLIP